MDSSANQEAVKLPPGAIQEISTSQSTVPIYVIASDENLFIAQEVQQILNI